MKITLEAISSRFANSGYFISLLAFYQTNQRIMYLYLVTYNKKLKRKQLIVVFRFIISKLNGQEYLTRANSLQFAFLYNNNNNNKKKKKKDKNKNKNKIIIIITIIIIIIIITQSLRVRYLNSGHL